MKAFITKGQLIYIDTDEGEIQIMDRADGQITELDIDTHTRLPASYGWEDLVGNDVEAIVVGGKTAIVCLLAEEA